MSNTHIINKKLNKKSNKLTLKYRKCIFLIHENRKKMRQTVLYLNSAVYESNFIFYKLCAKKVPRKTIQIAQALIIIVVKHRHSLIIIKIIVKLG